MSQETRNTQKVGLPDRVRDALSHFRQRVWLVRSLELAFVAICLWFLGYLILFANERFWVLSSIWRAAILLLGSTGFLTGIIFGLPHLVWRTRHLEQIARLVSKRFPILGEELLSVIEMLRPSLSDGASPRLIAAATAQTSQKLSGYNLNEAISTSAVKQRGFATLAIILVVVVVAVVTPSAAINAWARYTAPWTAIPRFTYVRTKDVPSEVYIPYAESFQVAIELASETLARPASARATIGSMQISAEIQEDRYEFKHDGLTTQSLLVANIGDATHKILLTPVTRPELKDVKAKIVLPSYLGRQHPLEQSASTGRLFALKGSQVGFDLQANHSIESAWIGDRPLKVTGDHVYADETVNADTQHVNVRWKDQYGLESAQPVTLELKAITDQKPEIVFEQLENRVLLDSRSLKFLFWGRDDYGIRLVGLEWVGQSTSINTPPVHGEKVVYAGSPDTLTTKQGGMFSPRILNVPCQQLTLRLFIEDYDPSHGRVYSSPQTLRVMSPDEHAEWIHESMQRWKSTADSIYERELQLAEENKRLRQLFAEDLKKPENLRRMENQIAAEKENAQRLDKAVQQGKQLIDEAVLNETMSTDDIATWADSLSRLKKLANQDMLDIARKLDEINRDLSKSQEENSQPANSLTISPANTSKKEGESSPENDVKETPSLSQQEGSMLPQGEGNDGKSPPSRLTLPQTELMNPKQNSGKQDEPQKEKGSSLKPPLDEVANDHDQLLREFEKARDAMDEAMANFENSTFVKRFKTASRTQLQMASQVNRLMSQTFGEDVDRPDSVREAIADLVSEQRAFSDQANALQADLSAYQSRDPQSSRQLIIEEMDSLKMHLKLSEMPIRLERGRPGDVLHRTEFWADTFDRWAEELVPPTKGGGDDGGDEENPSLPPAIALEVLRQIDDEIALRDETRSFELARQAMSDEERIERNNGLTIFQMAIQERALTTINDITTLPDGAQKFGDEIQKLKNAIMAMDDASGMLFDGTTGEPAIASETAAIEALIESRRRDPPKDSDPGKKNSHRDGSKELAGKSPLEILGPEEGSSLKRDPRDVGAGTSPHLDSTPERYREGLDRFSNRLSRFRKH